jgi:hypothetical protein
MFKGTSTVLNRNILLMREKKAWRKAIDQGEIQKALEDQSRARQDEL